VLLEILNNFSSSNEINIYSGIEKREMLSAKSTNRANRSID